MVQSHPACEQSCELNGHPSHSETRPLSCPMAFQNHFCSDRATGAALGVACPSGHTLLIRVWASQVPRFSLFLSLWAEQQNMQEWRQQWLQWKWATSNPGSSTMNHMKVLQLLGSWSSFCKNEKNKDLLHQVVVGIKYKYEQKHCAQCLVHTWGLKGWLNLKIHWILVNTWETVLPMGYGLQQTSWFCQFLTSELRKVTKSPSLDFLLCKMEPMLVIASWGSIED